MATLTQAMLFKAITDEFKLNHREVRQMLSKMTSKAQQSLEGLGKRRVTHFEDGSSIVINLPTKTVTFYGPQACYLSEAINAS